MHVQRLLRFAEDGLATIMDLRTMPTSMAQGALARQFTDELNALLDEDRTADGSASQRTVCAELHRFAGVGDPLFFMRWPPVAATMVHGAAPVTLRMWWMLRQSPAWRSVWQPALQHPQFGHPPPFLPMRSTNAMAIAHASHLFRFHRQQGVHLHNAACIIEFGGGFGSMCRLTRALGFRGKYIIFDLPPVLALQRYYLGLHGIAADARSDADVWLCPDLDDIMAWLGQETPAGVSLMSTGALSEMPMAVRQRVEPFFRLEAAKMALLAYQPSFEGNDNHAYFRDVMADTAGRWAWTELAVDPSGESPSPQENLYLFGRSRCAG